MRTHHATRRPAPAATRRATSAPAAERSEPPAPRPYLTPVTEGFLAGFGRVAENDNHRTLAGGADAARRLLVCARLRGGAVARSSQRELVMPLLDADAAARYGIRAREAFVALAAALLGWASRQDSPDLAPFTEPALDAALAALDSARLAND